MAAIRKLFPPSEQTEKAVLAKVTPGKEKILLPAKKAFGTAAEDALAVRVGFVLQLLLAAPVAI